MYRKKKETVYIKHTRQPQKISKKKTKKKKQYNSTEEKQRKAKQ